MITINGLNYKNKASHNGAPINIVGSICGNLICKMHYGAIEIIPISNTLLILKAI